MRAILSSRHPWRAERNHVPRQPHLVRLNVVLAAVGLVLALGLTGCGSTPTPGTMPLASPEADPSPVAMVARPMPGPSPTPELKPSTGAHPVVDVTNARINISDGEAPDPFSRGLSLWTGDGQRIDAAEVLSATVTISAGNAARRARWLVAMGGVEGGAYPS